MLRKRVQALALTLLLTAFAEAAFVPPVAAQGWMGGPPERVYDPATVETVVGTVTAIDRTRPSRRGGVGVHLTLQTASETVPVHLGPSWFLDEQALTLNVGDAITVRGSRIALDGGSALVAASLTNDGRTLVLRDDTGRPVWAGQGGMP